jgi:hypothetical protein
MASVFDRLHCTTITVIVPLTDLAGRAAADGLLYERRRPDHAKRASIVFCGVMAWHGRLVPRWAVRRPRSRRTQRVLQQVVVSPVVEAETNALDAAVAAAIAARSRPTGGK